MTRYRENHYQWLTLQSEQPSEAGKSNIRSNAPDETSRRGLGPGLVTG